MEPFIFLSYSRRDSATVQALYTRLKARGYAIWWDQADLLPGQSWELEIENAIENAGGVVVCLSSRWVDQPGYVHAELRTARRAMERHPEGDVFLIPVKLDECETPPQLRSLHWIRLSDDYGFEKLCRAIALKVKHHEAQSSQRITAEDLARTGPVLHVEVGVPNALRLSLSERNERVPENERIAMLVDTGASVSGLDEGLLKRLLVKPVGSVMLANPSGNQQAHQYFVGLRLASSLGTEDQVDVPVVGLSLASVGIQGLLGRDVLQHYRFVYDGPSNTYELATGRVTTAV